MLKLSLLAAAIAAGVVVSRQGDAPPAVPEGDMLEFAGDFVWNDKGGVVHWTHPDPRGRRRAGWIRHAR